MVLVCHVFLQEQVTKGSSNFMGASCSVLVDILASLVAIGTLVLEMRLVCQVILQGHEVKVSCDCMGRSPSR